MLGMEQHIFCSFIDYRGHHRQGVAIFYTDYVNCQPKPWFNEKTWIFEHFREVQMINNLLIDFDLVMKHLSGDLLRAAPL
jgi:hypothetical protein